MPIASTTGECSELGYKLGKLELCTTSVLEGPTSGCGWACGVYGRCSEGGLTTSSKAIGDFVLLLPGSCTCSLLIEASREGQILQGYKC